MSRAAVRQQGPVTVRASVLTDEESQRYFGASLAHHGIQAIWLHVDNASDSVLQFLPILTDPEYFSEMEVEQLLGSWWRSASAAIQAVVVQAPVPERILQNQAAAGFVFTHREGLKLFEVGFETGSEKLLFRFALPIRGNFYAIEKVDFGNIYSTGAIEDVDFATLRQKLAQLPCCSTNKSGNLNGDPLNIVGPGARRALFVYCARMEAGRTVRRSQRVSYGQGVLVPQRIPQRAGQPFVCFRTPTGSRAAESAQYGEFTEPSAAVARAIHV
jgi:hypothetical protein